MEHEVNVPFSVGSVRAALAEPERVARCVPGLQPEGADGAASGSDATAQGRMRVRIGNSTITYRGSLDVAPHDGEFTVKGTGTEARGSGSVRLNLTLVPSASQDGDGTVLVFKGTVKADGRIADLDRKAAVAAGHRLLERFGKALGESIQEDPPSAAVPGAQPESGPAPATTGGTGGIGEPGDNERVIPGIPGPDTTRDSAASAASGTSGAPDASGPDSGSGSGSDAAGEAGAGSGDETADSGDSAPDDEPGSREPSEPAERSGVFETDVPPSSLDPLQDEEAIEEAEAKAEAEAEAAHARRTMIGRSAEEVDHAPPRGRYAPVPVQESIADSAALRWIAPAAAAVVAGAVVIGRALRRRR